MQDNVQKRIGVIGSYNVGFTCYTNRLPVWGETVLGSGFSTSDGGKGANQAVAAARLGGHVTFVGKVGADEYGRAGIQMMENEGIETKHVYVTDQVSTGVGFIFLNDKGENCIVVDPGANNELSPADLDQTEVFSQSDLIVFQLENRVDTILAGMTKAHQLGKTTILNPAPAKPDVDELIELATIITPNESELLILSGMDPSKALSLDECTALALKLLERGPQVVIVTQGEKGALLVTKQLIKSDFIVPQVKAIDTTGAGDSFNGALAYALSVGQSIEEAVQFACYVGAYSVTKKDVIPALPTARQLEFFIKEHLAL